MSGLRAHIGTELGVKKPEWAEEWAHMLKEERLQRALTRLAVLSADADFCLFLLADYRYRIVRPLPDLPERDKLLFAVKTLLSAEGWWARSLQNGCWRNNWNSLRFLLQRAESQLEVAKARDEGLLWTSLTAGSDFESSRSGYQSTCLSLLDRHIKHASGRNRTDRQLLSDLFQACGLLPNDYDGANRWIEARLRRLRPEHRLPLGCEYASYHDYHGAAGFPCTRACELWRESAGLAATARGRDQLFIGGQPRFEIPRPEPARFQPTT